MTDRLTYLHTLKKLYEIEDLNIAKAERWFSNHPFVVDTYAQKYDSDIVNKFYTYIWDYDSLTIEIDSRIRDYVKINREYAYAFKDIRDFLYKKTILGMLKYCYESTGTWVCPIFNDGVWRPGWFHYPMVNALDTAYHKWMNGENGEFVTASVPPQHCKSSIYAGGLIPLIMGNRPQTRGVFGTYNADFAATVLSKDLMATVKSPGYQELFGKIFSVNIPYSDKQKLIKLGNTIPTNNRHVKMTTSGGIVFGGSLKQLTGNPAEFILIDDPIPNADVARSPTEVAKIVQEFDSSAMSRVRNNTFVTTIHTRWSVNDPIGYIIQSREKLTEKEKAIKPHFHFCYRAWYDPDDGFEYDFRQHKDQLLWERVSGAAYVHARNSDSITRNAVYNQRPIDNEIALIKKEWVNIVPYHVYPAIHEYEKIIISVDTSYNDKATSDKAAIGVIGLTSQGEYFVIDTIYDHMSFLDTIKHLEEIIREYPNYDKMIIETKANGQAVIDVLSKKYSNVHSYHPNESKKSRVASITSILEKGLLYVPDNNKGKEVFEQLITFTGDSKKEKDDLVDIITQCLIYCDEQYRSKYSVEDILALKPERTSQQSRDMSMFAGGKNKNSIYDQISGRMKEIKKNSPSLTARKNQWRSL